MDSEDLPPASFALNHRGKCSLCVPSAGRRGPGCGCRIPCWRRVAFLGRAFHTSVFDERRTVCEDGGPAGGVSRLVERPLMALRRPKATDGVREVHARPQVTGCMGLKILVISGPQPKRRRKRTSVLHGPLQMKDLDTTRTPRMTREERALRILPLPACLDVFFRARGLEPFFRPFCVPSPRYAEAFSSLNSH